MNTAVYDKLKVCTYAARAEMGRQAALNAAECIKSCLKQKDKIRCVFAAAPSQNEFLAELLLCTDIDWNRIIAFHMDEYIGLPLADHRSFGSFLSNAVFSRVPFLSVNYLNGNAKPEAECARYGKLLTQDETDIVFMGIGENGHIAFNDPPTADFADKQTVKRVELEHSCRMQQVHDKCFNTLDEVPTHALTVTIPALINAKHIFCIVPGSQKANAVKQALKCAISESCPASILRTKENAVLYLDADSAALL